MLGLLALWCGVFAPFAIFFGTRSLRRIRSSDGELTGATTAAAGLGAGLVAAVVIVVGIAYWALKS